MNAKVNVVKWAARAEEQLWNEESAARGVAREAVNVREIEDALAVVGEPNSLGIGSYDGKKLLYFHLDVERVVDIVWENGVVSCRGEALAVMSGEGLRATSSGELVVVSNGEESVLLRISERGQERLNLEEALPQLLISEVEQSQEGVLSERCEFAEPYTLLPSTLSAEDSVRLERCVSSAWKKMQKTVSSSGRYCGVIAVRWGARLWDGSYLAVSAPTVLGGDILRDHYRSRDDIEVSDGKWVAIPAMTHVATSYRIGVSVVKGVDAKWKGLIRSIDLLVSDEVLPVVTDELDYRAYTVITSGTRHHYAEVGAVRKSASRMWGEVLSGKWRVVASASGVTTLEQTGFSAVNTKVSTHRVKPDVVCRYLTVEQKVKDIVSVESMKQITLVSGAEDSASSLIESNGRLIMGGGSRRLRNLWGIAEMTSGDVEMRNSRVSIEVLITTGHGVARVVREENIDYSPQQLCSLLSYPDARATYMIVTVENDAGTMGWEGPLLPLWEHGMAVAMTDDLRSLPMIAMGATYSESENNVEYRGGEVWLSAKGNPFVVEQRLHVTDERIEDLAQALRPIYQGGFGRYPVYVFTSGGIYALPSQSGGTMGEARLVSRSVIARGSKSCESRDAVWYVTERGTVESVSGATVSERRRDAGAVRLAWDDCHREMWLAGDNGSRVVMPSGRCSERSVVFQDVYSDRHCAVGITDDGELVDLEQESATAVNVVWESCPIRFAVEHFSRIGGVEWDLCVAEGDVRLTLRRRYGRIGKEREVKRVVLRGAIGSPVVEPVTDLTGGTSVVSRVEGRMLPGSVIYGGSVAVTSR